MELGCCQSVIWRDNAAESRVSIKLVMNVEIGQSRKIGARWPPEDVAGRSADSASTRQHGAHCGQAMNTEKSPIIQSPGDSCVAFDVANNKEEIQVV